MEIQATCHKVVMYFYSQPEAKNPATEYIENALVAMATTIMDFSIMVPSFTWKIVRNPINYTGS